MRIDDGDFLNQCNLVVVPPFHSRILRLHPVRVSDVRKHISEYRGLTGRARTLRARWAR